MPNLFFFIFSYVEFCWVNRNANAVHIVWPDLQFLNPSLSYLIPQISLSRFMRFGLEI